MVSTHGVSTDPVRPSVAIETSARISCILEFDIFCDYWSPKFAFRSPMHISWASLNLCLGFQSLLISNFDFRVILILLNIAGFWMYDWKQMQWVHPSTDVQAKHNMRQEIFLFSSIFCVHTGRRWHAGYPSWLNRRWLVVYATISRAVS